MNSDTPASSIWQRLSPFLDVIGAVLIFGSWIASNTLSQHALSQANAHQAIVDRVRQFRLYDDFSLRISKIQSDLARTRNLAENATARSSGDESEPIPNSSGWTGMTATKIWELNSFVDALARYAEGLSDSKDKSQSIENARNWVHEISQGFRSARDDYDRIVPELDEGANSASTASGGNMKELRQRIDHLWQEYDRGKVDMLRAGDELLRNAASRSAEANQVAERFRGLSYAFYLIGTMIILFGRAKSALSAKKGTRPC
jgi:hypothetical protein